MLPRQTHGGLGEARNDRGDGRGDGRVMAGVMARICPQRQPSLACSLDLFFFFFPFFFCDTEETGIETGMCGLPSDLESVSLSCLGLDLAQIQPNPAAPGRAVLPGRAAAAGRPHRPSVPLTNPLTPVAVLHGCVPKATQGHHSEGPWAHTSHPQATHRSSTWHSPPSACQSCGLPWPPTPLPDVQPVAGKWQASGSQT